MKKSFRGKEQKKNEKKEVYNNQFNYDFNVVTMQHFNIKSEGGNY